MIQFFCDFFAYLHLQWAEFVDHVPKKGLLEFCQYGITSVKGRNAKPSAGDLRNYDFFMNLSEREWNLTCKINGEEN